MVIRHEGIQLENIKKFWIWFGANAERLRSLHAQQQFSIVAQEINRELDKVEPQLAWEMGPGRNQPSLLTISSEGNPELRPLADLMIREAPPLNGWEFYSSRPARPAPAAVRLPETGKAFSTSEWRFIPVERRKSGRLDLLVLDEELARSDRETALKAVSIYLDQVLGEETVETWIGKFTVQQNVAAPGERSYKMSEIPDYLLWATHRKENPLKSPIENFGNKRNEIRKAN